MLCLFEDFAASHLLPLTHLHPDFDLRCGIFTARERAERLFPDLQLHLYVRSGLTDVVKERTGYPVNVRDEGTQLFINGRALLTLDSMTCILKNLGTDSLIQRQDQVVACTIGTGSFRDMVYNALDSGNLTTLLNNVPGIEVDTPVISYPWDLITYNGRMLVFDAGKFPLGNIHFSASVAGSAELILPENIYIGENACIGSGAILDATEGPVVIDKDSDIMHQVVITGPAYIGRKSKIKIAAKIYGVTSIGPVCKVGGELEGSIMHSYANKQHEGFLGHSYLAAWTNIGADTNTSDLKNNYSEIRMTLEGCEYPTGLRFLGTIMADHSKCGINTMFNTGTCIGVGCNIFGGDFPPKYMPDFTWGGSEGIQEHEFERFLATTRIVLERRGVTLTMAEETLLRSVFDKTARQRSDSTK